MGECHLKIGFVGAGANTRNMHIPGFHKLEGVELSVVANRTLKSAQKVAKQDGIKRAVKHWREVVEDPSIDAVCIGTWPNLHAEVTIAALEHGKHVLCEARMAANLEEARAMIAAAKAHPNQVVQLVPAPFSLNFDNTIRDMLETGKLGKLLEVRAVHTGGQIASPEAPMNWRLDHVYSGKNVLTMGIVHETIERWVNDEPEWVMADSAIFQDHRSYPNESTAKKVRVPDSLSVFGRFGKTGARMIYHFSGVESGKPRMEFRLNGSKGALRFDAYQKQLLFAEAGSEEEKKITLPRSESRGWQVEADFIQSILQHVPVSLTSFEQGLRYMTFTEMVTDSCARASERIYWKDYISEI